ncbi:Ankyrin repeat domain-containing protein 2 [Cladobotryum mycophilum]|uniref:Ankyrin repeat domain-containing protein 2 n=1 Tax=Cladobotryum mycophilum TaxID=491253 RepID=A0ABR0SYJ2_9HYPO
MATERWNGKHMKITTGMLRDNLLASLLRSAAAEGHTDIARLLIQKGANIETYGRFSLSEKRETLFGYNKNLLKNRSLFKATSYDRAELLKITPLGVAARNGHFETVKMLLDHGANLNDKDGQGQSALFLAKLFQQGSVVRLLCDYGADMKSMDENNESPLDWDTKRRRRRRRRPAMYNAWQKTTCLKLSRNPNFARTFDDETFSY